MRTLIIWLPLAFVATILVTVLAVAVTAQLRHAGHADETNVRETRGYGLARSGLVTLATGVVIVVLGVPVEILVASSALLVLGIALIALSVIVTWFSLALLFGWARRRSQRGGAVYEALMTIPRALREDIKGLHFRFK